MSTHLNLYGRLVRKGYTVEDRTVLWPSAEAGAESDDTSLVGTGPYDRRRQRIVFDGHESLPRQAECWSVRREGPTVTEM